METKEIMSLDAKIHNKKVNLQLELGAMSKDGDAKNNDGKILYSYIGSEALDSELKPLLRKHNLDVVSEMEDCKVEKIDKKITAFVKVLMYLIDLETGYIKTYKTFAYAEDFGDKAVGKAFTEAKKRWLFKNLFVTSQDSKLFDIDFYADDGESNKIDITPKPKTENKPEPKTYNKPDESNLRVALMQLITAKKADNNIILKVLSSYGFKNADEVPPEQHEKILRVIPELYNEFLKSEEYKKSKKETK
jgi:hypothetical protein